MNKTIHEIIHQYKAGELTAEDANRKLKEAGASFYLDPEKNPGGGWTEAEMREGFLPGDPASPKPERPDMSRNEALAGMTAAQVTKAGTWDVTYDGLGYAVKAVRQ